MSKLYTYGEAVTRFANLATTGITIEDAVKEAVQRIYELGRYPGSTKEIQLSVSDFVWDADVNAYFIDFDEETYDGAIGFRTHAMGWSIMDQTALYRDGINAGDREFIDYGIISSTSEAINRVILVSGDLIMLGDPFSIPELFQVADYGGKQAFSNDGLAIDAEIDGVPRYVLYWFPGDDEDPQAKWVLGGGLGFDSAVWTSTENVADPLDVDTWTPAGTNTGTPVLAVKSGTGIPATTSLVRRYRCPLSFQPSQSTYYALLKLEAPELDTDTVILIATGPLKHAILAVCQEYVGDDNRSEANWIKFENAMVRAERQTHGPKRFFLGFDSSLKRNPRQFH